jgi:polysaccharide biosynthesis protein PslG
MKVLPALIAVVLLAVAPGAGAKVPPRFMGVNWDSAIARAPTSVQDPQFPRMARAGVQTMRTAFLWAAAQPEENGPVDLSATDALVGAAAARHIEVFPHIITAPDWARLTPAPMAPPSDPHLFESYVGTLVARYGTNGSFWTQHPELPRLPIRYWQFWNEPHLPFQWDLPKGRQKYWPKTYVEQLKVFYATVHSHDPAAKVVLGGLANRSWVYLGKLYRAGARGFFDVAAIHPYTTKPSGVVRLLARFRKVMRVHHDRRKPVWVTELGLPASKGRAHSKNTLQTTPRGMARYLTGAYTKLRRLVPRVYWYTWASEYRGDVFRFTGLFRYRSGTRQPVAQPAYRAYVKIARELEGK